MEIPLCKWFDLIRSTLLAQTVRFRFAINCFYSLQPMY